MESQKCSLHNEEDTLMTIQEVADRLKISVRTVHAWIKAGKFQKVQISVRAVRVKKSSVDAFLAAATQENYQPSR